MVEALFITFSIIYLFMGLLVATHEWSYIKHFKTKYLDFVFISIFWWIILLMIKENQND